MKNYAAPLMTVLSLWILATTSQAQNLEIACVMTSCETIWPQAAAPSTDEFCGHMIKNLIYRFRDDSLNQRAPLRTELHLRDPDTGEVQVSYQNTAAQFYRDPRGHLNLDIYYDKDSKHSGEQLGIVGLTYSTPGKAYGTMITSWATPSSVKYTMTCEYVPSHQLQPPPRKK